MGHTPQVNVIIVNWNGRQHLADCLPSLLATRYPNFRIMVLDNGSTDGSMAWLQVTYPGVETVALGRNLGFAAANNAGVRIALATSADYAVLLNNDTRVELDWLDALVSVSETDPSIAICQARQRTWEGSQEIRFRFIPEWVEVEHECVPVTSPGLASLTPFASGCGMLLRCSALRQIGLFDERYFMYVEDVDLTLRAWIGGFRVMDVPEAIVYHRMTGSGSVSKQRMFWGYRNQLTTLLKLYGAKTLRQYAHPISRRWLRTRNRIALRGTMAALAMLPGTLTRRRIVQRNRKAPDAQFLELCVQ
jgi:GT2 family glycosyltransferase